MRSGKSVRTEDKIIWKFYDIRKHDLIKTNLIMGSSQNTLAIAESLNFIQDIELQTLKYII